ncbi:MAG: NAD-dependent dehydratase [Gammaproteobacteria bacterium]|nr:NAD-dependent dehydratase [Gammaproteobacteria bacterium]
MLSLVTGGAGFIGSHLAEKLISLGHEVVILDDFSTGREQNLVEIQDHPRLRVYKLDICDEKAIQPYFLGVDWVFHLAALADIVPSIQNPLTYLRAGVAGTQAVVEASRIANVKRLVYAASSSCYGIPELYPTPESSPIKPQYPYALAKYLGEQIVMHWSQVYDLPVMSLRLFNVYGTRSRTSGVYGAVFGVFLAQKLAGKPFTVVGDGTQTRDFTYVSDVANAFVKAAESNIGGEILNVGSSRTYSVNQLVDLLGGSVAYVPRRPGEPDQTFADTTKIGKLLGWTPEVEFTDGVQTMLRNIEYWRNAPVWEPASIAEATRDWFRYLDH